MGYLLCMYLMLSWCVPVMQEVYDNAHSVYFRVVVDALNERGFKEYFKQAENMEFKDIQRIQFALALFNDIV